MSNRIRSNVVGIALAIAGGMMIRANVHGDDWPRLLGGDFENTAGPESMQVDFTATPTLDWSLDVGDGYGLGCVADEVYYHFDGIDDPDGRAAGGRHQSRLRAIDLGSGQTVWSQFNPAEYRDLYGYESGPRTSPTVAGSHIYTMSVDGRLSGRKIVDGQLVWSIDTSKRFGVVQNFFGVGGSPLVVGDRLYAMVGGSPAADQSIAPGRLDRVSPNGSLLVCVDRLTGRELWHAGDDLASYSSPRTITLDDRTFVLIYGRDHLWCFDAADGSVAWKYRHRADILETVNAMMPVVIDNKILISECYSEGSVLLRASADGVQEIWKDPPRRRQQSMRVHWSTPVREGNFLYGCSGRNAPDSSLRCIDWTNGKLTWEAMPRKRCSVTKIPGDEILGQPGARLLVWTERGQAELIAANPDRFESIARWSLPVAMRYPCWASPVVIGDRVLLRDDTRVICLRFPRETSER